MSCPIETACVTEAPQIGVLVVGDGNVVAREIARHAPAITFAQRSFAYPAGDEPFCEGLARRMSAPALALREEGAALILLACTTAVMRCPRDVLQESLAAAVGLPVISVAEAMVAHLRAIDARTLAVATPYGAGNNAVIRAYFDHAGLAVRSLAGLDLDRSLDVWRSQAQALDVAGIVALAQAADDAEADAICLPSTGIAATAAVPEIARRCRKPVVTAIGAGLAQCLQMLGDARPLASEIS